MQGQTQTRIAHHDGGPEVSHHHPRLQVHDVDAVVLDEGESHLYTSEVASWRDLYVSDGLGVNLEVLYFGDALFDFEELNEALVIAHDEGEAGILERLDILGIAKFHGGYFPSNSRHFATLILAPSLPEVVDRQARPRLLLPAREHEDQVVFGLEVPHQVAIQLHDIAAELILKGEGLRGLILADAVILVDGLEGLDEFGGEGELGVGR